MQTKSGSNIEDDDVKQSVNGRKWKTINRLSNTKSQPLSRLYFLTLFDPYNEKFAFIWEETFSFFASNGIKSMETIFWFSFEESTLTLNIGIKVLGIVSVRISQSCQCKMFGIL